MPRQLDELSWWQRNARRIVAVSLVILVYWCTRLPRLSQSELEFLSAEFRFAKYDLPDVAGPQQQFVRQVHPDLQHIASWISSVGAACSLADLDGDGLPNDVCYVDTRTNQVIVTPVPGTSDRYVPFVLDASAMHDDEQTVAPTGCVPGDLNEDGQMDVLVYYWGRTPVAFLRHVDSKVSPGLAPSTFVRCDIMAKHQRWYTNAATRADVDGDGHVDLVIGNYFPDDARILDPTATDTQHMHHSMSRSDNGGRNRLLLWDGGTAGSNPSVRFREVDGIWDDESAHAWTLGIGACDLDGDLLPELYFANDFGHDRLFHNRSEPGEPRFALLEGRKGFFTPNSKVLGRDSFKGMGVDFADLNGDGLFDIYVSNIAEQFALEESHFAFVSTGNVQQMQNGVAPYVERSESLGLSRSGWGWESRLADFNNDGVVEAIQATGFVKGTRNRWPQLHEAAMGNDMLLRYPRNWHRVTPGDDLSGHDPNPFFVRAQDGRFYDVASRLGLDDPQVTRGIATADVDGDGDLDFVVGNQWDVSRFYRNDCPQPKASLVLRLLLPIADNETGGLRVLPGHVNPAIAALPAIGAAATVTLANGKQLVGQVDGGNGHSGTRSPEIHLGLGDLPRDSDVSVDLHWRGMDGNIQHASLQLKPGWHTVLLGPTDSFSDNQLSFVGEPATKPIVSR